MAKIIAVFVAFLASTCLAQAQNFSLKIDAGYLKASDGTTNVPVNGLLQLIALPSGTISAPTSSSYVGGDNVLVASFAMNYTGGTGETFNVLNNIPFSIGSTAAVASNYTTGTNYTLTSGELLLLRFYPSLTYASAPSAPTLGTTYGQVRSNTKEFTTDTSETSWIVPGSGATADLNYITVSDGGSYANTTAYASNTVGAANVPEPSSLVIQGGVALGLLVWGLHRRRVCW